MDSLIPNLLTAGLAALTGAAYAYTTYMKKDGQTFDIVKCSSTIILAAVVGFVASFWRTPESLILESPLYAFGAVVIENIAKWFYRKIWNKKTGVKITKVKKVK